MTVDWVDDGILKKESGSYWTGGFSIKDEFLNVGSPTKETIWSPDLEIVNGLSGEFAPSRYLQKYQVYLLCLQLYRYRTLVI
jgi:hypothetical protein